ncbi:Uncharacterised protein [Mycobacteroides abscessus subsp. abscessus]|nr:Uncharacterised protein [Mycobacteroides abscessus subsp. abscessus]
MGGDQQLLLGLRFKPVVVPDGAVLIGAFAHRDNRQFRSTRQVRQPVLPPLPVTLVRGRIATILGAVPPVGISQFRLRATVIERRQIRYQDPVAHRVAGKHVDVEMQSAVVVITQGQRDVEHLPVLYGQALMRLMLPQFGKCRVNFAGRTSAQIHHGEHVTAGSRHGLLCAVGQKLGA